MVRKFSTGTQIDHDSDALPRLGAADPWQELEPDCCREKRSRTRNLWSVCLVRNPIYAGIILACIGSAIVAGGAFIFLLIILGSLFIWQIGAEDKLMERQFPNEYPDYKRRTKALIPFVW